MVKKGLDLLKFFSRKEEQFFYCHRIWSPIMIVSDCRSYSPKVQITWLWVIVDHILSRWLWVIVAQEKCDCRHLCWGTISRTSISYIIAFTWYFMIVTKDLFVRDQKRVSSMTIKLIFNRSSHERYWPLQKNIISEHYSGKLPRLLNSWPRVCIRWLKIRVEK